MTALERAARAVQDEIERQVAETGYLGWGSGQDECRPSLGKTYVDGDLDVSALVRAVLMAVREPSVDMSEAIMQNFSDPCWPEDAKQGFAAMIDAILNEKDTTND